MRIMKALRQVLERACLFFTLAEFLLLFIATGYQEINPSAGGTAGMYLSLGSAALIFLACLLMSALQLIFRLDYSLSIRLLLHFIGSMVAFALVFIVIPGVFEIAQILIRLLIFAALYLVIAFVALIFVNLRKNKRSEELEYESLFGSFSPKK